MSSSSSLSPSSGPANGPAGRAGIGGITGPATTLSANNSPSSASSSPFTNPPLLPLSHSHAAPHSFEPPTQKKRRVTADESALRSPTAAAAADYALKNPSPDAYAGVPVQPLSSSSRLPLPLHSPTELPSGGSSFSTSAGRHHVYRSASSTSSILSTSSSSIPQSPPSPAVSSEFFCSAPLSLPPANAQPSRSASSSASSSLLSTPFHPASAPQTNQVDFIQPQRTSFNSPMVLNSPTPPRAAHTMAAPFMAQQQGGVAMPHHASHFSVSEPRSAPACSSPRHQKPFAVPAPVPPAPAQTAAAAALPIPSPPSRSSSSVSGPAAPLQPSHSERTIIQLSNHLLSVPLLARLSAADLDCVATAVSERMYSQQNVIVREGDAGQEFFIIKSGSVVVTKQGQHICTLKAGDYFGEQSLITGNPRCATIMTMNEECHVFVIDRQHFHQYFTSNRFNVSFGVRAPALADAPKSAGILESLRLPQPPQPAAQSGMLAQALAARASGMHKTREDVEFMKPIVKGHILFEQLAEGHQNALIDYMYLKSFSRGEKIIHQGEPGQFWAIVRSGSFDIFKVDKRGSLFQRGSTSGSFSGKQQYNVPSTTLYFGSNPSHSQLPYGSILETCEDAPSTLPIELIPAGASRVATCGPGTSFGELALLYNSPRAATVIATEESQVWLLDRNIFRLCLQNWNLGQSAEHEQFLQRVNHFNVLLDYERARIGTALEYVRYPMGHEIFRQGDQGDLFFIVKSGFVSVFVHGIEVSRLSSGDYFGERALIAGDRTRSATCIAMGPVECMYFNRLAFNTLLKPLEEIFVRKLEKDEHHNERHVRVRSRLAQEGKEGGDDKSSLSFLKPSVSVLLDPALINMPPCVCSPAVSKSRPELLIPDQIAVNELAVLGTLGKGSFGTVSLVRDKAGNTFALKCVSKQHVVQQGQQEHILNEKRTMSVLNHSTLTRLLATHKDKNYLYFLLEPSLGGELFSVLRARTYFDEATARFYAASVILAFEYLHARGIIYRDLKPENLLLDTDSYPKLCDMGFAKLVGDGRTWTLCGTPDYLSPEVVSGQGHGKGVDWWTLGIFIFEMLASFPPFYDEEPMKTYAKILQGQLQWPQHFSPAVRDLISGLLCPKPTKRLGVIMGGANTVKYHRWFAGFDWPAFEARRIRPPITVRVNGNDYLSNFEAYPIDPNQGKTIEYTGDPKHPDWDKDF